MESINIEGTNEDLEFLRKVIDLAISQLSNNDNSVLTRYYLFQLLQHIDEQIKRPLPF